MKTETVIESWVRDGSSILDLGCGDGSILEALRSNKSVQGYGIEINLYKVMALRLIEKTLNPV